MKPQHAAAQTFGTIHQIPRLRLADFNRPRNLGVIQFVGGFDVTRLSAIRLGLNASWPAWKVLDR
jgi:hypothetical protein